VSGVDELADRVEEGLPRATRQWELRKTLLLREASTEVGRHLEPESFRIELRARSDYGTPTDPQV
jgi:hypothetical protein